MPTYDYICAANEMVVEVKHRMNEGLTTWGELCERTGTDPGNTPADSPVARLATGGQVVKSSSLGDADMPACGAGGCCPSGGCGLN